MATHRTVTVRRVASGRFTGANDRGDEARAILSEVVRKSHDRLCTVGRTIELGTPIASRIA
jgi:hypothetical protein